MKTIPRRAFIALLLGPALAAASARDGSSSPPSEAQLRQDLQDARWPADIVRAADRYLGRLSAGPGGAGSARHA